jgi:predicted amidohydrolase YtcJ
MTNVDIRERMYKDQMDSIEDELTPFGEINNGLQADYFVSNGDLWKVSQDDETPEPKNWMF